MMEPTPAVERCTSILLHDIFDHLWLPDIFHVMGVNRRWREHAINHPTYYGELYLFERGRAGPIGSSRSFFLRLSRSAGRPVYVHVELNDLTPIMPAIADHLAHIQSLTLRQHAEHSFAHISDAVRQPAEMLRRVALRMPDLAQGEAVLPPDFLAGRAPALEWVALSNISFPGEIPHSFSNVNTLLFSNSSLNGVTRELPNPFERCTSLQELRLSGNVTVDDTAGLSQHGWERLSQVTFSGHDVAMTWPTFHLPFAAVPNIKLVSGNAASVVALADTLSGQLDVSFPRPPGLLQKNESPGFARFIFFTAVLRSHSRVDHLSRELEDCLFDDGSISAFSISSFANRIVRLALPLCVWDDIVGLSTFGPFNALQELVLTLHGDADLPDGAPAKLSCPRLHRLVLIGEQWDVDFGAVANFALAALPDVQFPLHLNLEGIAFNPTETWKVFPRSFPVDLFIVEHGSRS